MINESRAHPPLPYFPFLIIVVTWFLVSLGFLVRGFDYGPAAVPISAALVLPPAIVWLRPMIGWALALFPLSLLLPLDRTFFGDALEPMFWYACLLVTQLPVVYAITVAVRPSVHQPAVGITLLAGLAGPFDSGYNLPDITLGAAVWTLALTLTFVLARFWLHRRDANTRLAEEEGLRRILEERARIARELHDVVAHHMSVIAVQAATAPYRLDPGRADVVDEFQSIGASARASLQELRQLLDVLRGTAPATSPGLADVPKLIESARVADVPVRLIMAADLDPGAEAGYAAYRIVQESLSNVVRHAPGAETTARIALEDAGLVVEVINERSPRPVRPAQPGHGLTGMRERAAAVGGTLNAGPTEAGGFRVHAVIPITGSAG